MFQLIWLSRLYYIWLFICHVTPQRQKHSVIERSRFFSSQKVSFYISLIPSKILSILKQILYFAKELLLHRLIFKALQNSLWSISFWERNSFELSWRIWKEIHYESVSNHETHPKSGFNHKEIGCLFIYNEILHFLMFLKIIFASLNVLIWNLKTFILLHKILRLHAAPWFFFFGLLQRVLPSLSGMYWHIIRSYTHEITGWFSAYAYVIYSI